MNSLDTIQHIISNRSSICRYGDGEFMMIFGGGSSFQEFDSELSRRLFEVLNSDDENILIGIPRSIQNLENLNSENLHFWKYFTCLNYKKLKKILRKDKVYYDSLISRFYNPYQKKSECYIHLQLLRKIWENRDICIIEGSLTRSGVGNDLFENASSVIRILCPPLHAYSKHEQIFQTIINNVSKDTLILLSLGMTATVLAYDLAKIGYQAIDLGHLDIEYEWYKLGVEDKVIISDKYVNEVFGGNLVGSCNDTLYKQQILAIIN